MFLVGTAVVLDEMLCFYRVIVVGVLCAIPCLVCWQRVQI